MWVHLTDTVGEKRGLRGVPIPLRVSVCVCVCVCERESESEPALMGGLFMKVRLKCYLPTKLVVLLGDTSAIGELAELSCLGVSD